MKIAIYQGPISSVEASVAENLVQIAAAIEQAAAKQVRLLILPEMILSGYNIGPQAISERAEAADGAAAQQLAQLANKHDLAILYGYPERADGKIYNSAQLIDRDGQRLANHRKTHLFGDIDRAAFSPGSGPPTLAELDGLKLGIAICYDVEFPENIRLLALAGADLVTVPTALMQPYEFIPRTLVPARAYENQVFMAYANRCGEEYDMNYYGLSCIIAPDGSELARAGTDETLICAELDLELQAKSRALNTYLADRRPELYSELAKHTQ